MYYYDLDLAKNNAKYYKYSIAFLNKFILWKFCQIPEPDASIQSIAIDPEGTYMAAVNNKGKCYVWRLSGGTGETPITLTPTKSLLAHNKYALKVKFSPDST